jgi:hypothetical protein
LKRDEEGLQDILEAITENEDKETAEKQTESKCSSRLFGLLSNFTTQMTSVTIQNENTFLGDKDVRPALLARLLVEYQCEPDTIFIEELGLCRGQVRIDLAVVNGQLHGFEIKSDRDSLRRLSGQVDIYNKVFDRVTLVVGDRHLDEAVNILPTWWGILRIIREKDGIRFKPLRKGRMNPRRERRALVELLWLEEALALLEQRNEAHGIRGKPRRVVWDKLCKCYTTDEIAENVRQRLKARVVRQVHALPS